MKMQMQRSMMQTFPYEDADANLMMQIACAILIKSFPFYSNTQFILFMGYSFFILVRLECQMQYFFAPKQYVSFRLKALESWWSLSRISQIGILSWDFWMKWMVLAHQSWDFLSKHFVIGLEKGWTFLYLGS